MQMSERCSTRCLAAGVELIDLALFRDVDDRKQVATDADIGGGGERMRRRGNARGAERLVPLARKLPPRPFRPRVDRLNHSLAHPPPRAALGPPPPPRTPPH